MLTIDKIITLLQDRNLKAVSRTCGLAYGTVWRIANKKTKHVSYMAVEKLSNYLTEKENG